MGLVQCVERSDWKNFLAEDTLDLLIIDSQSHIAEQIFSMPEAQPYRRKCGNEVRLTVHIITLHCKNLTTLLL